MIVGIDIGSQSLKAVLIDDSLRVAGSGSRAYRIDFPRPGWAEQDPQIWEQALSSAIGEALAAAGRRPADVAALGIAGQLDGCIAADADGAALSPCLIWMDRRADAGLADLRRAPGNDWFRARTGANLDGSHMAPKARWLQAQAGGNERILFHQPVSYLVQRLTGEAVMDHGLASTSLVYDLPGGGYADELLGMFGLTRGQFPRLERGEAVAGALTARGAALTGLPAGIVVAVGTGDDFSTPLGAGVAAPGIVANILGTAEVTGALDPRPLIDVRGLVETHRYVGTDLNYIENPGWVCGGALEWLRALLSISGFAEFDRRAEAPPPGADGLLFLPALTGAMTPEWIAGARGCFYGLTPSHGPGHLARAVLEGTAFGFKDVVDRLREMGIAADRVRLLGGGARSRLWAQIRADVTGLPVERSAVSDSSAVGAALLAAVAAGRVRDLAAAASAVAMVAETVAPDPRMSAVYEDAHGRYRRLFESLKPMF
jgi:xylulokinase